MTAINLPDLHPNLVLDFANSRGVDPRIKFSRASTATYFDEFGVMQTAPAGVPRIDYDPATGECRGLLVEEQRTNLLRYSEQFDNGAWVKSDATVTANAVVAPDGTSTSDLLVEGSSKAVHRVECLFAFTSGVTYTVSIFVKLASGSRRFVISLGSDAFGTTTNDFFDLSEGTVAVNQSGGAKIEAVGSQWFRCSTTRTASVSTNLAVSFRFATSENLLSYQGDGTSGLYIWGAQLEKGSFPTSYIPTTDSQVTRAADVASMTGTNFSGWYRQDEGTFTVDYRCDHIGGPYYPSAWYVRSDISNRFGHTVSNTNKDIVYDVITGGVVTAGLGFANTKDNVKSAFAYKLNNVAASTLGASAVTDTSTTIPHVSSLDVGCRASVAQLNGHIRRIAYYPRRITNDQLQSLTTI